MIRNWTFAYLTLDNLAAESFELLPESAEPPAELRRPTTASGKKVPLKDIMSGAVSMAGEHRLYERRTLSWSSKTAHYVEVERGTEKPRQSEDFRPNNCSKRFMSSGTRGNSQKA